MDINTKYYSMILFKYIFKLLKIEKKNLLVNVTTESIRILKTTWKNEKNDFITFKKQLYYGFKGTHIFALFYHKYIFAIIFILL